MSMNHMLLPFTPGSYSYIAMRCLFFLSFLGHYHQLTNGCDCPIIYNNHPTGKVPLSSPHLKGWQHLRISSVSKNCAQHYCALISCNAILTVNLGGSVLKARSHLLLQSQQFDCLKMDPTKRYFEHPWFLQPPLLK